MREKENTEGKLLLLALETDSQIKIIMITSAETYQQKPSWEPVPGFGTVIDSFLNLNAEKLEKLLKTP